jgi:flagellar hook-associated protein 2
MALGSIYSAYPNGRPSGLPDDIVDQLVKSRQQQTLKPIEQDISETKSQKDVYSKLNSTLTDFYGVAKDLNATDNFSLKSATSSNSQAATASAESQAASGSYSLEVSQLAQAHTWQVKDASALSDPDDAALINNGIDISFEHEGASFSLTTDDTTTLNDIAAAINETENLGVTASVVNTGTEDSANYILKLKSDSTGAGAHRITTDGTTAGVSISGGNLFSGGDVQEEAQAGQNAQFSIDGVSYERSTNTVDDALQDVSLSLLSDSAGPTTIDVALDTGSITKQIQSFVKSFNAFDTFLDKTGSYNQETGQAGPLLGDPLARSAQSRLRSIIGEPVSGTEDNAYQYLSQIGIELQRDGSISLDEAKLSSALEEDTQAVAELFTGENGTAGKVESYLKSMTNSYDGVISSKIDSIENQIDQLNEDYEDEQQDLKDYEERLIQTYSDMEQAVLKYQSMGNQLDSYIQTWNANSKA